MASPELKPCPCCLSVNTAYTEIVGYFQAGCLDCGLHTDLCDTPEEAAAKWNRREEPKPTRNEALEAKKEKCFRILVAELHSMEATLQRPFLVGDPGLAKSHVEQAAYELGEVLFELAQSEKEDK